MGKQGGVVPSRELRVVMGGSKDDVLIAGAPLHNTKWSAIGLTTWGVGETLTRVSRTGTVVPWLAERVHNVDPLTWQVDLRPNARFCDGTRATPAAVAASFAENLAQQADVAVLIDPDTTTRVVNESTLEFRTPRPCGHFAQALAHPQLIVHAAEGTLTSGPYRAVEFEPDRMLELRPFAEHWAGPPALERVTVTVDPNLDAQMQALETGDADLIYAFPPEAIDRLARFDERYHVASLPSMRALSIQIHTGKPPFDDRAVREATALAIDRDRLVAGVLGGHGAVATGIVPPWAGYARVLQRTDLARARQLLDAAGWTMQPDGVRAKGECRLAFTMYTPRGEVLAMAALARAVRDQLAPFGFDIQIQEVAALSAAIKDGAYTSALRTSYAQLSGDPYFWLRLWLGSGGRVNQGPTYVNPHLDSALEDYRSEIAPEARMSRWRDIEQILEADVPHIFLVWAPLIVVTRNQALRGHVPDPNNEYFLDSTLSVAD